MKKRREPSDGDDIQPEYDFSKGVRGKYARRYALGTNVRVLAPDIAAIFPDSKSLNEALRGLIRLASAISKKKSA